MENGQHVGEKQRKYYRVVYPLLNRPKLVINRREYEVIDISEKGIKFSANSTKDFWNGLLVCPEITFHDKQFLNLEGKILRSEGAKEGKSEMKVIIQLSKDIPYGKIMEEQRYIMKNYPNRR